MPCNCGGSTPRAQQQRRPPGSQQQAPTGNPMLSKDYYYTGPRRDDRARNGPPAKPKK